MSDYLYPPLMEMRCPSCTETQFISMKSLSLEPRLTSCQHCKKLLVHQLEVQEKPNHILFKLHACALPDSPLKN